MGLKESFATKIRENEAREAAIRANPALANTPEVKRQRRFAGLVLVLIGVALVGIDMVSLNADDSVIILFVVLPVLFIPLGIYMLVFGKNPPFRLRK